MNLTESCIWSGATCMKENSCSSISTGDKNDCINTISSNNGGYCKYEEGVNENDGSCIDDEKIKEKSDDNNNDNDDDELEDLNGDGIVNETDKEIKEKKENTEYCTEVHEKGYCEERIMKNGGKCIWKASGGTKSTTLGNCLAGEKPTNCSNIFSINACSNTSFESYSCAWSDSNSSCDLKIITETNINPDSDERTKSKKSISPIIFVIIGIGILLILGTISIIIFLIKKKKKKEIDTEKGNDSEEFLFIYLLIYL
jgi:hypothetical protein